MMSNTKDYNNPFSDSELETIPSDYEGVHEVYTGHKTDIVVPKKEVKPNPVDVRATLQAKAEKRMKIQTCSSESEESEVADSDENFSDTNELFSLHAQRNDPMLTQKILTQRMRDKERGKSVAKHLRQSSRKPQKTDNLSTPTYFIPFIPETGNDRPVILDTTKAGDVQTMMLMFQKLLSEGRVLTGDQLHKGFNFANQQHTHYPFGNINQVFKEENIHGKDPRSQFIRKSTRVRDASFNKLIQVDDNSIDDAKPQKFNIAVNVNLGNKMSKAHIEPKAEKMEPSISKVSDSTDYPVETNFQNSVEQQQKRRRKTKPQSAFENRPFVSGIKELPRSLGPDWVEVEKKARGLHRRNAYSQMVSWKNSNIIVSNKNPEPTNHLSRRQIAQQYAKGASVYVRP